MTARENLQELIDNYSTETLKRFFREKSSSFKPLDQDLRDESDHFKKAKIVGEIRFEENQDGLAVYSIAVSKALNERNGRRAQYDFACKQLRGSTYDAGVFVFYGNDGSFRFSLVSARYEGTSQTFNNYRRSTYFVSSDNANGTFIRQIGEGDFSSLRYVKEAFSIQKVTDDFYEEFKDHFFGIAGDLSEVNDDLSTDEAKDFTLLFMIRTIFLGFIQKREWLGDSETFLEDYLKEYQKQDTQKDTFYSQWIDTLFFQALNTPPEENIDFPYSKKMQKALSAAPYLNGGLFRKGELDKQGLFIPDKQVKEVFDFLFNYNFVLKENDPDDEEIALNPEFLGIIFEKLVNKDQGAIYTPRTEVDLMCRLSLVKWLNKNTSDGIRQNDLYELLFPERGEDIDQKYGSFSEREIKEMLTAIEGITVCDPAAGSGAFLVGMLQVIDDLEERLHAELGEEKTSPKERFVRRERIIARSLYGVEVKEWAVWIAQLRLWITLFVDAPDELRQSQEPILPSLDFKIKQGDSLVQRIGETMFPVTGYADIGKGMKDKIGKLKNQKTEYFENEMEGAEKIKELELSVFEDLIDGKIAKNQKMIDGDELKDKRQQLFDTGEEMPEQKALELDKERVEKAKRENKKLKEQKSKLSDERPFIWNIEFAEVFADGGFDVVVGNPPYLRHEDIADPQGLISDDDEYKKYLNSVPEIDFRDTKITKKTDLSIYFYLRSLRLLNSQGILTFVCTNAWLDTEYGADFQEFLLLNVRTDLIIDNHARRSFTEASINTIISLMHAPKKVSSNDLLRFVAFKKPFENIAFSKSFINVEKVTDKKLTNTARTLVKTRRELIEDASDGSGKYKGEKWGGKFLRAPDSFYKLVTENGYRFSEMENEFEIKYGNKPGATKFFLPSDDLIQRYDLEDSLEKAVSSTKQIENILIDSDALSGFFQPADELSESVKKFIKHGESEGYGKRPSLVSNKPWYKFSNIKRTNFILPEFYSKRFFTAFSAEKILYTNVFWGVSNYRKWNEVSLYAFLNSTFYYLELELFGRTNLGEGVLSVYGYDFRKILVPKKLETEKKIEEIAITRKVESIFRECGIDPESETPISEQEPDPLADRKELDDIIFDELELTDEERKDVYRAVCQLVHDRISKANSV